MCKAAFTDLHSDKVQVVKWNLKNESILLSGGYDSKINLIDVRNNQAGLHIIIPKEFKDIENV